MAITQLSQILTLLSWTAAGDGSLSPCCGEMLEGDVILNLQQLKLTEAQEHDHHQLESKMVELLVCLQDEEPTGAAADN